MQARLLHAILEAAAAALSRRVGSNGRPTRCWRRLRWIFACRAECVRTGESGVVGTQEGGDSRPLPVLLILTLPMAGQQGEPVLRYRSVRLYLPPPSFNRDGCAYRINVRGICYVATGLGIHPRKCMQHTNGKRYHSTNERDNEGGTRAQPPPPYRKNPPTHTLGPVR